MLDAGGASLFVMPAFDGEVAITKLITFTPANAGSGRPDDPNPALRDCPLAVTCTPAQAVVLGPAGTWPRPARRRRRGERRGAHRVGFAQP